MEKSLDVKLAKIKADPNCREFILADAKDADMAYGIAARRGHGLRDRRSGQIARALRPRG